MRRHDVHVSQCSLRELLLQRVPLHRQLPSWAALLLELLAFGRVLLPSTSAFRKESDRVGERRADLDGAHHDAHLASKRLIDPLYPCVLTWP